MTTTYKINELFETIQGEGSFTGQPSIFIRLQGCPVACSWCDTKHTWDINIEQEITPQALLTKNQESDTWSNFTVDDILSLLQSTVDGGGDDKGMRKYSAKHIVLTGGEPCMYDLTPLCEALEAQGYSCQVETSGTFEVKVSEKCWVTVSPKINMKGGFDILEQAMLRANEIKHPVATEQHVVDLTNLLARFPIPNTPIYLQPISQKARATKLAIKTCIANNWRLSVQVHKYLGIE